MASVVGTKRQTAANRRNSRPQPPGARPMLRPARPHRCYPNKGRKILTGSHAALCDPYRLKNPAGHYPDRPSPFNLRRTRSSSVSKPPARNSRNNRRNQNGRPNLLSVNPAKPPITPTLNGGRTSRSARDSESRQSAVETHAVPREDRRVWVPPRLRVHHRRFLSMVASEANHRKLLIMKEQTGNPTKLCWRAQK